MVLFRQRPHLVKVHLVRPEGTVSAGQLASTEITNLLAAEVADLAKGMREFLLVADRFVYFTGLVGAAALTVGVLKHNEGRNWLTLVFAPYAMAMVFVYLTQIYTEVEKRAGYKRYLEELINVRAGYPVLLESTVNALSQRRRRSVWGMQIINVVGLVSLAALGIRETRRYASEGPAIFGLHIINWHYANIVFIIFTGIVLVLAVRENMVAGDAAYRTAKAVRATGR